MSTVFTAATIIPIAKTLAKKVALSLATKSIVDGVGKLTRKSPEERVAKALEKALNQVAVDNEFWKNDVKRQVEDVILILIHTLDDPRYIDNNPLPHYLDKETIESFKECLKKDPEAWDYIQKVQYEEILQDIRTDVRETKVIVQDTNTISRDTNERVRRIEENLTPRNATAHFLTDIPSKADSTNVIGREGDLRKLWKTLQEKYQVLLTGFGGIGKTKLAQMLFHSYENQFDEMAWIEYRGNLKRSFLGNITAKDLQFEGNEDDRWRAMKSILTNDGKNKLFIIDNVDHDASQQPELDSELRDLTGWKDTTILLTSRLDELSGYNKFRLDALELENCVQLFQQHYKSEDCHTEIIVKIIELAHRHTLTIELLAKGAKRWDLEDYYNLLVEKGFQALDRNIVVDHDKENATIERHLRILFDMQSRSELDKKILNSFAILPVNCECKIEEIKQWFGFKNSDLDNVIQDGWLRYDEESGTYFMHPLVRTIVRFDFTKDEGKKRSIAPKGTADKMLQYIADHDNIFKIDQGYSSLQRIISIVESVMEVVTFMDPTQLFFLLNKIGHGYDNIGDYDNALKCYLKDLQCKKTTFGTDHYFTAVSYNNIGLVYKHKGEYDNALKSHLNAFSIAKKILDPMDPNMAIFYNNIGLAYDDKGNYSEALDYYFRALTIKKKYLGNNHPSTGTSYNNIGWIYKQQGNYNKALEFYNSALAIWVNVYGKNHPFTAGLYSNIGELYGKQGVFNKALEYHSKALKIRKRFLGIDHPAIAQSYNNIGWVYREQRKYEIALEYYTKAYQIYKNKLGEENPDTQDVLKSINEVKQFLQQPPSAPPSAP